MKNLPISVRIWLAVAAFAVPLAVVTYAFWNFSTDPIKFAEQEVRGDALLKPLTDTLNELSTHQQLTLRKEDATEVAARATASADEIENAYTQHGTALQFTEESLGSRNRSHLAWEKVKPKLEATLANGTEYDSVAADLRGMIAHTGDTSNLILDPDLDSYYLMDVVLIALPQTIDRIRSLEATFIPALAEGELNADIQTKAAVAASMLREADIARIAADMDTTFKEDPNFNGESPTLKANLEPVLAAYTAANDPLLAALDAIAKGSNPGTGTFAAAAAEARSKSGAFFDMAVSELDNLLQARISNLAGSRNTELMMLGAALLASMALFVWVSRGITRPLSDLRNVMVQLAEGHLDTEIPYATQRDEIGAMAKSVEYLKENSVKAKALQGEQELETQKRTERAARMENMVKDFEGKVGTLLQSVHDASREMSNAAEAVVRDAETTTSRAQDTATATGDTSHAATAVAAGAEELTAAINEIARQVSRAAGIAAETAQKAAAADGTIQRLAESAGKIGEVIQLIDSIAGQINLLALNATIESARAGEAGKGFAVVASEVKNLAGQTGKATEAITSQIAGMQSVVDSVVSELAGIRQSIDEVNGVSSTIAAAVQEQDAATQEIARNINTTSERVQRVSSNIQEVDQMARNTSGNASQLIQNVKGLSEKAQNLSKEIGQFLGAVSRA